MIEVRVFIWFLCVGINPDSITQTLKVDLPAARVNVTETIPTEDVV